MNNIYKVIWSKAKNCYVVASEIARSHTKSASGSEKIGGGTRRKLLASLMALSLLCGGLGVAGATLEVLNQSGTTGAVKIYTKEEVDNALKEKGLATDVATNKANIAKLQEDVGNATSGLTQKVTEQGEKIATNTANIAKNADNITKLENNKADKTALAGKADKTYVDQKLTEAGNDVNTKLTDVDTKLAGKADKTDLENATKRIAANEGEITALKNKTGQLSADGKELKDMTTVSGTTVSGTNVEAGALKVTGEISNGAGVTTTLSDINNSMTQTAKNKDDITALKTKTDGQQTAINGLNEKTTQISYDAANHITSVNGMKVGQQVDMGGKDIINAGALTATGKVTGDGVEAGTGAITGGSLTVTGKVTGNGVDAGAGAITGGSLSVTGDTSLKKTDVDGALNVTGESSLKNTKVDGTLGVTGATTLEGTLTAEKDATFEKDVTVKGTTNLKDTTVTGDLTVTGTITTDKMVFGVKPTNYTEIDQGKVTSKNSYITGAGEMISSSSTFDVEKNEVGFGNGITGDQSYHKQTSDVIMDNVNDQHNSNNRTQTKTETTDIITDENGNTSTTSQTASKNETSLKDKDGKNTNTTIDTAKGYDKTIKGENGKTSTKQEAGSISSTVYDKDGKVKASSEMKEDGSISNNATGDLTTKVGGNELHEVTGTKTENVTGKVTENYNGGQETKVTGDKKTTVTGKTTEEYKGGLETTVTGDEKHTVTGNQTTNVTGDISNKAENITNEANTKLTDKVGENTRVLDHDGITDTVGGSTFKQRIDKIMMESKDVSIKAEETLTNEAKVITNKASEVINNEAININNTATGIITSKASEIKNQADKLISNKVGENTWENMENGKITTSIKDGAKQNLTQSDAAGTTQSTVDGAKSTVTIQNADGLTGAVTDGRNTSVQNQTASAIATDVKDGAGNENASVANATTSANTITNGTKANTVISTADGTSFINSEANTAFEGGTYTDTTIKGNTITTGKVKMDYAEVMRDLGVHGNTTLGEAGKDTTLTVNSKATFNNGLTVTNGETKLKNTTIEGTLNVSENATFQKDVTANSFSVNGKTYIDSDGLNANNQVIRNVADGSISEGSKDAVNGGQLYGVKRDLEHQVDKVGANAAAMANLRPMEFDPSSKWNIAAAIGNYGSETAAALGAFYRPNDNVMVNLSTAFGTGENMVGGGVSVRLGKGGNKLSREETNALKAQVDDLTARMDALLSVLNPNMSKDFPDVPENHWAYEAVSRLAGNDIVQGYPDGEFHGERTMTRYEMAEIIYNALSRGAEAERELVEEFKPELQAMAASEKATAEKAEG